MSRRTICIGLSASLMVIAPGSFSSAQAPDSLLADLEKALDRGAELFARVQNPDGGYGPFGPKARVENASDVGITALVVAAIARHPRRYRTTDGPFLSRAVEFLLQHQQEDGGFYHPKDPVLTNYRTCVAVMALSALDRVAYSEAIGRAQRFIKSEQYDESKGYDRGKHLYYGAIGHSGSLRGDLSNSGYAAEALSESGVSASDPIWRRLDGFVSLCQNHPSVDPLVAKEGIGTTADWGFRYQSTDTRGPAETLDSGLRVFASYGSMTYQGLKSLLYAQVSRDDPRVKGALEWIARNFTVTENPGMVTKSNPKAGLQGLYYYYHVMAKTLFVVGQPALTDASGKRRDWARELAAQILSLQRADGSWQNDSGRFWEDLPVLDSAYAMLALSLCRDEILRQQEATARKVGEEQKPEAGKRSG